VNEKRIIPALLLKNKGLVKGVNFKDYKYIGDPLNAVKIFNDKEVDELIFLDISATSENRPPDIRLIRDIADECYMPFAVGGGIKNIEQVGEIIKAGSEKVVINSTAVKTPELIKEVSSAYGHQSVIVSIDVKKNWLGKYHVFIESGSKKTKLNPIRWAMKVEDLGAGEILLNSINKDGTMSGYDTEIIQEIAEKVSIPVIACGGAGNIEDFAEAARHGASAVSAGSMFVFSGPHRAVLINYPDTKELELTLYEG
jgi:cyclase